MYIDGYYDDYIFNIKERLFKKAYPRHDNHYYKLLHEHDINEPILANLLTIFATQTSNLLSL